MPRWIGKKLKEVEPEPEPEIEPEFYEAVRDCLLDDLDVRQSLVLLYFFTFDKTDLEIINLTGWSESEVVAHRNQGIQELMQRFPATIPE